MIGYDLCTVESAGGSEETKPHERFEEASQLIRRLYNGTLDGYWADRRTLLDRRYHGVEHPEELYSDLVRCVCRCCFDYFAFHAKHAELMEIRVRRPPDTRCR